MLTRTKARSSSNPLLRGCLSIFSFSLSVASHVSYLYQYVHVETAVDSVCLSVCPSDLSALLASFVVWKEKERLKPGETVDLFVLFVHVSM